MKLVSKNILTLTSLELKLNVWLVLALQLSAFWALRLRYLMWGEWSFDQGHNLLIARLIDYGYQPYSEIFMDRPPLFFWSIGPAYSFFHSVEALQITMLVYSVLGVAAMITIGATLNGRLTGLLAGFLLAFNFRYFLPSATVMPEMPAMSLALVALALALRYRTSGRRRWLIASAATMGGSFLINYFMPWMVLLILLTLLAPGKNAAAAALPAQAGRRILVDGLLWSLILLIVAFGSWLVYDVSQVLDQAILFHLLKSEGTESSLAGNVELIWQTFANQPVLTLWVIAGLAAALTRLKKYGWLSLLWFALTLILALVYSPLRSKHLLMFTPMMALLAAQGVAYVLAGKPAHKPGLVRWGRVIAGGLLLVLLVAELFNPYEELAKPRREMVDQATQPLVALLQQFTAPTDCMITDHPYLAFVSGRLPPPWLANLSYARFDSGSLDTDSLVARTEAAECQVVAPVLDRIKNSNRDYYNWAKANSLRVWVLDGKEVMVGNPLKEAQPLQPLHLNFAGQVELVGADWRPGERHGYLSLYWKTLRPFNQNYKIFVQLRNEQGQTVASADHEAYNGLIPMQLWRVDTIFKDTNRLDWPAELGPGPYTFYVGLYDPATLERLPIEGDTSGENAAVIPGITVGQ
jgi:hypothetical protein